MPGITMCTGEGCPMKEQCFRFTAKVGEMQSYFAEPPVKANGQCEYFLV